MKNPCRNNATCQSGFTDNGYRCLCTAGFKGRICTKGKYVDLLKLSFITKLNVHRYHTIRHYKRGYPDTP